jgi:dTDP-4-amino-4,6-dideoxygalactose transaminase
VNSGKFISLENVARQYPRIRTEVEIAIADVLPTGKYVLGPNVHAFEEEFAAYCQTDYCVGISNGTEALHLALVACGIGPGDEVITVPNTYIATAFAISYVGAKPVLVDVDSNTYNMDPVHLKAKITPRTKAILPVHLYGQTVDMDPLMAIAEQHKLWVIEDAAHAHGAEYKGRRAGSLGHIGCFSFYPTKVLGCYGDGGAVTTSDPELYDRLRMLRYMGQRTKYLNEVIGFQQRLDEMQAAVLRVKLRHLDHWIAERQERAIMYAEFLAGLPVTLPLEMNDIRHVYYLYTIRTPQRDALMNYLAGRGIETQVIYPRPIHYQPAYQHLNYGKGDFPVTDDHLQQMLCLPMFPELTETEVREVTDAIGTFFSDGQENVSTMQKSLTTTPLPSAQREARR